MSPLDEWGDAGRPAAVVTGGSNGIGRAVVAKLLCEGVPVTVVDLQSPSSTESGLRHVQGSAADRQVLRAAFEEASTMADRVGIFVACAGISRPGPSLTYSVADWNAIIDLDLGAVFTGACIAAAQMGPGGSIVAIGSVQARLGFGGRAAYSAAKAGVTGLVRSLAVEWAHLGVRVNSISPGYIATELVARNMASGALDERELLARIPAGRLGNPEEIADAVWFLSSRQSTYITGTDILVDGGMGAYGLGLASEGTPQGAPTEFGDTATHGK
jgi:NAD(P)-dependent dehydrogenase (short-subunit alcohol dehydrogenase family)